MKKSFSSINDLHNYLVGIHSGRPGDHHPRIQHAGNVDDIVFELTGLLIWRADHNSIEVNTRRSMTGNQNETNMLWFTVGGRSYALVYRHANRGQVDLCDRNVAGTVRASFDNASTHAQIKAAFAAL